MYTIWEYVDYEGYCSIFEGSKEECREFLLDQLKRLKKRFRSDDYHILQYADFDASDLLKE